MKTVSWVIIALFLLSPLWTQRLAPHRYEGGRSRNVRDRAVRNSSAAAMILGEMRASASDLLFIKTERYLDHGIAYEPHLKEEILSVTAEGRAIDERQAEAAAGPHAHDHEHDAEEGGYPKTIIRTAAEDFRGFIGHLQRRIKPWRDPRMPHEHTGGTELLPWYRLMTLADPHNARAYAIGAWWLKQHDLAEAIRFVEEGLRYNPQAFQLHYALGSLLYKKALALRGRGAAAQQATPEEIELYTRARGEFLRAAEMGLARRPAGWTPEMEDQPEGTGAWTLYEDEDVRAAARFAVLLERNFGDPVKALAMARDFAARLDGDGILERQISLLEKRLGERLPVSADWERRVLTLDELAEQAAEKADDMDALTRAALAVRLRDAARAVAEATFPPDVKNPAAVELAQLTLDELADRLDEAAARSPSDLTAAMQVFHSAVEDLMRAAGMEHGKAGALPPDRTGRSADN
ncbi:MAG: hypothetical protein Kow0059_12100 [Candidatus Sumerlaeia bacterium]